MKKIISLLLLFPCLCFGQVNLKQGLRAYYSFSGNAGDASGNNNNPVYNNATLTADRFGNPKSAYHFNGRSNYMRIRNNPTINTTNKLSLCVWVKPQGFYRGTCHANAILMKGDTDYLTGSYLLRFDDNAYLNGNNCYEQTDPLHQNFYGSGVMTASPGYTPYIETNQWYNVVVTYDGTTARLYINCVLKASTPQNGATFTNGYDLFFGKLNNDRFPYWFTGDMDELRIYDRALNKQEIQALCNEKPLVVEKPEFVKVKKPKDSLKLKKETVKIKTTKERTPLVNTIEPVTAESGFIDPTGSEMEKEIKLQNRKNDLVKEIIAEHDSVSITLYDNGDIDGDSITLIFNDKVLTTHQLLTDKPLTFFIKLLPGNSRNELVMYAENLGSIPPNTALMVIYDGTKRYELNVSSTKNSNGSVRFKLRE